MTRIAPLLPLLLVLLAIPAPSQAPDLIVHNAAIESMDVRHQGTTAIAIRGDRILALGSDEAMLAMAGEKTRKLDAKGAFLMPGLIESHAHLVGVGQAQRQLDVTGLPSYAALIEKVKAATRERPKGSWIVGRGWDQNTWDEKVFPDHAALSAATPDHPVVLTRVDGHALLANAKAMEIAGISAATTSPEGGEILKRADGSPTGVFIDKAENLVNDHVPAPDAEELKACVLAAQKECLEQGITTFHDAGTGRGIGVVLMNLLFRKKLRLRIYAMASVNDLEMAKIVTSAPPMVGDFDNRFTLRAMKVYADGALGSRGAALIEDYSDRPGHKGLLLTQQEEVEAISKLALEKGYQVCVHAIGDRANRMLLDTWEKLFEKQEARGRKARFRIEHAQILHEDDIPRFAELGVIASMQAIHCTSDGGWVPRRIARKRAEVGAYAWRSLLDTGAVLCNGTDAPVEPISPFANLYAAVTRKDAAGDLEKGFFPEQCMSRMEALASYTLAGAYAGFEENLKGRLAPGLLADFILVDRDLRSCADEDLLGAKVLATYIGGENVYRRK